MNTLRSALTGFIVLLFCLSGFAQHSRDPDDFAFILPLSPDSTLRCITINAHYSNPVVTFFRKVIHSSTDQYGISAGYAENRNNRIIWSAGIGVHYGGYEYSSAFTAYNRSLSVQFPLSVAVGKPGFHRFSLRAGISATPLLTLHTKEYSAAPVEQGDGSAFSTSYRDPIFGGHIAFLPQLNWINLRRSFTLTLFSPGCLFYADDRLQGGLTLSTHFTWEIFLRD